VSARVLRIADERDVRKLCARIDTGIPGGAPDLRSVWERAPWRVQVTDEGDAVILEQWRTHLDYLAIGGLWCADRDIAHIVGQIPPVARRQGFSAVLSPIVSRSATRPYEQAGMAVAHECVVCVRASGPLPNRTRRCEVALRHACVGDASALTGLDAACFDEFWRCDLERMGGYLATQRGVVAEVDGSAVGYTLCTAEPEGGVIGRLAVAPSHRRLGIGYTLLGDALEHLSARGAREVTLCTQVENHASRALYAAAGFRERAETAVLLAIEAAGSGGEA